jgi:hypothetical protein
MNITTIIELDHEEVEELLNVQFVFVEEKIYDNMVHTCVDGFVDNDTKNEMDTDEAMERLFAKLKEQNVIPQDVIDFSYELTSCERVKKMDVEQDDLPKKVAISFLQCK